MVGINTGFFLGGVAQGQQALREEELRNRALGIQEQQLAFNQNQELFNRATEEATTFGEHAASIITEAPSRDAVPMKTIQELRGAVQETDAAMAKAFPDRYTAGTLTRQFDARIAAAKTKGEVAEADALAEVTGARTTADAVGGGQDEVLRLLNIAPRDQGEFLTLMDRLTKAQPGSEEAEMIRGRINKLSGTGGAGGASLIVNPDGSIIINQGGAQPGGGGSGGGAAGSLPTGLDIPAGQLDALRGEEKSLTSALEVTDLLLQQIQADPKAFGATGTIQKWWETVEGVGTDLAPGIVKDIAADAGKVLKDIIGQDDVDPKASAALLKPTSGSLDAFERILQYQVARSLQPDGRLLQDAVNAAADIVKLRGLRSSEQVADRLNVIRSMLGARQAAVQQRMQQGVTGQTTVPSQSTIPQGRSGFTADQVRPFDALQPNEAAQLRPFQPGEFVDNGDGTMSTERTLTVPLPGGQWANVPSLWMSPSGPVDFGRNDDAAREQAIAYERQTGQRFPRYRSSEEGIAASKQRSSGGGVFQGSAAQQQFQTLQDVKAASFEDVRAFAEGIATSQEAWDALPAEVQNAILQRLKAGQ